MRSVLLFIETVKSNQSICMIMTKPVTVKHLLIIVLVFITLTHLIIITETKRLFEILIIKVTMILPILIEVIINKYLKTLEEKYVCKRYDVKK